MGKYLARLLISLSALFTVFFITLPCFSAAFHLLFRVECALYHIQDISWLYQCYIGCCYFWAASRISQQPSALHFLCFLLCVEEGGQGTGHRNGWNWNCAYAVCVVVCCAHSVNALLFNVEFFTLRENSPHWSSLSAQRHTCTQYRFLFISSASYANIDIYKMTQYYPPSSPLFISLCVSLSLFLLGVLYLLLSLVQFQFISQFAVGLSVLYLLDICAYICIY